MNKLKENKAITLIALVITIIVLLILAGVTIAAISGNESIMGKGTEAREKDKQATELDSIKLAVVNAKVQGSYDLNVDQQALKEGLEGIVDNPEEVLTNSDSWTVTGSATKKLYTITKDGQVELVKGVIIGTKNVKIAPSKTKEITATNVTGENITWTSGDTTGKVTVAAKSGNNNIGVITVDAGATIGTKVTITATAGTESDTCEVEVVEDKAGAINSKIGKTVQYSVTPTGSTTPITDWQVFYADAENEEVFIISKDIIETNTAIGNTSTTSNAYADGPAEESLATGTYGRKYNSIWLGIENAGLNGTTVNNNAKSVAYLCDASTTGHWAKYAGGAFGIGTTVNGIYAVGGPTIELLAKSVTANPNVSSNYANAFTTSNVTTVGYSDGGIYSLPEPYKAQYIKSDNTKAYGYWWLASPGSNSSDRVGYVDSNGYVGSNTYYGVNDNFGVRPLVSIPLSEFQTSWINNN